MLFQGWKEAGKGMLLLEKYGLRQQRPAVLEDQETPLFVSLMVTSTHEDKEMRKEKDN